MTPRRRRGTSCRPQCMCSKLKTSYAWLSIDWCISLSLSLSLDSSLSPLPSLLPLSITVHPLTLSASFSLHTFPRLRLYPILWLYDYRLAFTPHIIMYTVSRTCARRSIGGNIYWFDDVPIRPLRPLPPSQSTLALLDCISSYRPLSLYTLHSSLDQT